MEKKKNNAFEKAENIMNKREKTPEEVLREKEEKKIQRAKKMVADNRERNRLKEEEEARKAELKEAKEERKDALKKQKFIAKRDAKIRREKDKMTRKERNRGLGGWITAVVSLGVSTLILASVLTFTFLTPSLSENLLEASYKKAFYDSVEQADNIDLNMSKTLSTGDSRAIQTYLTDLSINSELLSADLNALPLEDESKYYTMKLVNQIGDFSKYLNKKLINGQKITAEERQSFERLYYANSELKNSLLSTLSDMDGDYSFYSLASGNKDFVVENFDKLQNLSVEYPELIYDGPFSDGLDRREIKGLSGEEITEQRAREIFGELFGNEGITDVESVGSVVGEIPCFTVQALKDGDLLYAQISKQGGKLINFSYSGSCRDIKFDREDAEEVSLRFLEYTGITDMKAVWVNLANNVYTINFVYEKDGIIYYPDMIKVRVCAETCTVIGIEAETYFINHTERETPSATISETEAVSYLYVGADVLTQRLCVVPIGEITEKLCYEFSALSNDATFYIYIDAENGRQVQMFKVIESTEGLLLM